MRYNLPYLIWGCTHHAPYFQFTLFKFENHKFSLKHCMQSCIIWEFSTKQNKIPVASGGLRPQTPCLRDTILGLAPPF